MATVYKYMAGGRPVEHVDEEDAYTPDDIRAHWAQMFPELSNATWEETKDEEGRKVVTFTKKIGVKG